MVGIAGAGGLGSNVAMLLVRTGVRRLCIADDDRVEPSNLNRQFYLPRDVGESKVRALRERLLEIETDLQVTALETRVEAKSACALFAGCSAVVEALDGAEDKARIVTALVRGGFFVVSASGLGGWGLPPLSVRRLGPSLVCVGDFTSAVNARRPALAPRVMQAAALQADAVITRLLEGTPGSTASF